MKLYLNGSTRQENCYQILKDLKQDEDIFISLGNKTVNYCMGCNSCQEDGNCVIEDDMEEIYDAIEKVNSIVIVTPIYFNHITGILKTIIDRCNPYTVKEGLKGKTIYLMTVGAMPEDENVSVAEHIDQYFQELCEIFECNFVFLRNFTTEKEDKVKENYENYDEIIKELKQSIK